LAERHPAFGSALNIELPEPIAEKSTSFEITIKYTTTERCTALQFLEPELVDIYGFSIFLFFFVSALTSQ